MYIINNPINAGMIKFISQSPKVATNALTWSNPADVHTKMANSPLAMTLKKAGIGKIVCTKYMPVIFPIKTSGANAAPKNFIISTY